MDIRIERQRVYQLRPELSRSRSTLEDAARSSLDESLVNLEDTLLTDQ